MQMILCPAWVSNVRRRRRIIFSVFLQVPICEEEKYPVVISACL
jgi:hypothetical protein